LTHTADNFQPAKF